jgi:U3 small nucleolar RNA-associated protein 15
VHVTKFHPTELSTLLTASDDRVVRLYDLTSSTPLNEFKDHSDYTRAACFIPSTNLVATGCYDGMVRLYDTRTNEPPIVSFKQDAAVEDILALNSTTIVSAGGPMVKVWDLAAGQKLRELANFQKTVSTLCDAGDRGVLAGSLDGHVKIFDSSSPTWEVKFGWKFGGAVLSTAFAPDQKHFVTGLASGLLSIRTRKTEPKVKQGVKKEKSGNFARMMRGAEYHGEYEHAVLSDKPHKKKKLNTFEKHINAFRWSDALDAAFVHGVSAEQTVTVLEELRRRGKVLTSLQGRDEQSLEPIIKWAVNSVHDTRCVSIIADWIGCIVDLYGAIIDSSPVLESLISHLTSRLRQEVEKAKEAKRIEGMLELLLQ